MAHPDPEHPHPLSDASPGDSDAADPSPSADAETAHLRSLWEIMGSGRVAREDDAPPPDTPPPDAPPEDPPARPTFGLWAVMGRAGAPSDVPHTDSADSAPPAADDQHSDARPPSAGTTRGFAAHSDAEFLELSDLPETLASSQPPRPAPPTVAGPIDGEPVDAAPADTDRASADSTDSDTADSDAADSETADSETTDSDSPAAREPADASLVRELPVSAARHAADALPSTSRRATRSTTAMWGLFLSTTAVLLAVLAGVPSIWAKLPSCVLGFAGATLSYIAIGEIRRAGHSMRGMPMAIGGLIMGCFGLFAGPTLFAPLGQRLQSAWQQQQTRDHLLVIGDALSKYEAEAGHYPSGGTLLQDAQGEPLEGHGWLTQLLPYLGYQSLYDQIDQRESFEALSNREPLSQFVEEFLVAGAERATVGPGFAPAHFAGVGGIAVTDEGRANLGIFAAGVHVRSDQIEDGLSQTLVAGEIANRYPAWGSPTNWRRINKGLNQDYGGFGNQAGNGALFLHADGSVRFYGNATAREILERLSTRDGHDPVGRLPQK